MINIFRKDNISLRQLTLPSGFDGVLKNFSEFSDQFVHAANSLQEWNSKLKGNSTLLQESLLALGSWKDSLIQAKDTYKGGLLEPGTIIEALDKIFAEATDIEEKSQGSFFSLVENLLNHGKSLFDSAKIFGPLVSTLISSQSLYGEQLDQLKGLFESETQIRKQHLQSLRDQLDVYREAYQDKQLTAEEYYQARQDYYQKLQEYRQKEEQNQQYLQQQKQGNSSQNSSGFMAWLENLFSPLTSSAQFNSSAFFASASSSRLASQSPNPMADLSLAKLQEQSSTKSRHSLFELPQQREEKKTFPKVKEGPPLELHFHVEGYIGDEEKLSRVLLQKLEEYVGKRGLAHLRGSY